MPHLVPGLAVTAVAALAPATALAAPAGLPAVKSSLSSASTTDRTCHASLYRRKGIARTSYRVPMSGYVTLRGRAARGNWDLAVFDARTRRALTSSESFSSNEVASTWVASGQRLLIRAAARAEGGLRSVSSRS